MIISNKVLPVASALILLATARAAAQVQTLDWPVVAPRVTQDYACLNYYPPNPGYHSGIDMVASVSGACTASGPAVTSAANDGTVYRIQTDCPNDSTTCGRGFGNHVIVEHPGIVPGGESFFLVYAHLRSVSVSISETDIQQGQEIGVMGMSSAASCHLHFDVLDFAPGQPGLWVYPNEITSMGYDPYGENYPTQYCDGQSGSCLDAKNYMTRDELEDREVRRSQRREPRSYRLERPAAPVKNSSRGPVR